MLSWIGAMVIGPELFRLWQGDAPGSLGAADADTPTIELYRAAHPNGTGVVICPGGGYMGLAPHEGKDYALFLNRQGITCAVLKYRLGSNGYRHPVMLNDVTRAIRFTRFHAKEWGIDPGKVGVMGSSAGGHLASTVLTHWTLGSRDDADPIERESSKPTFGILCYAVITMGPGTHAGSREALLGRNPAPALVNDLSNERQVSDETPPCFIWSTADDRAVPVTNSIAFASSLVAHHVPCELHVYPHGPHGLGLGGAPDTKELLPWTTELVRWLRENHWA